MSTRLDSDNELDQLSSWSPLKQQSARGRKDALLKSDNFAAALAWLVKGYNVVPQKGVDQKFPGVRWKDLQDRRVTEAELQKWRHLFENGLGFISGAVSGVIVIETDGQQGEALLKQFEASHGILPNTLTIRSGSGRGFHRHYKHPGHKVKTKANPAIKIDVKGDGGFCVLPPSVHKTGGLYEVVLDVAPATLPEGLLDFIELKAKKAKAANAAPDGLKVQEVCSCNASTNEASKANEVSREVPAHSRESDASSNLTVVKPVPPPPPVEDMRLLLRHLVVNGYFDERAQWIAGGMALKVAYGDEVGFELWAITHEDERARIDAPAQWESFASEARPGDVTIGTLIKAAKDLGFQLPARNKQPGTIEDVGRPEGVTIDDFYAYMPMHQYIFKPNGELWPASSVDSRLPRMPIESGRDIPAHQWLDQNRAVEQMTWAPGEPQLIPNRLVSNGGWMEHSGANCFNLYRPPIRQTGGILKEALPWLMHIHKLYPNHVTHIVRWLAQRVQRPQEKINHALVLGGSQGIGKDTILEPVKRAVGPWNFEEVSPQQLLERFNGFVKSVILRVSEARDLGDVDRFQFYEHMKTFTASPPDTLRVDEKHLREYHVLNCVGVIITTNHKTDGIHIPPDDRRHYVAWSDRTKDDFDAAYWNNLWGWYEAGGYAHVAALLSQTDISAFDPKAPPPKTPAFWDIVDANRAPEDSELADALDALGNPPAVTLDRIKSAATANSDFYSWISDRKNRRVIPHRLEKCGYVPVRNPSAHDGQWKIGGKRVTVYARKTLSEPQRQAAAAALAV